MAAEFFVGAPVVVQLPAIPQPALPSTGNGAIYFDSGSNKLRASENGGAYVDLIGGGGGATLAATLGLGNVTGGTSIIVSTGDRIDSPAAGTLNLGTTNAAAIIIGGAATAVSVPNDLAISGDLTVNGTVTTINTANLTVTDPLIYGNSGAAGTDFGAIAWDQSSGLDAIMLFNPSASGRFEFGYFNTVGGTVVPSSALVSTANVRVRDLTLAGSNLVGEGSILVDALGSALVLGASGPGGEVLFSTGFVSRWKVDSNGDFTPEGSDNAYDIGVVGLRPRTIRAATSVVVGGTVTITTNDVTGSTSLGLAATGSNPVSLSTNGLERFRAASDGGQEFTGIVTGSAPAASGAGKGKWYFDSTLNQFMVSSNGGAYAALATGGASGWTDSGTVVALTTATDQVGIGTVAPGGTVKVEVVAGAFTTGLLVSGATISCPLGSFSERFGAGAVTAGASSVAFGNAATTSGIGAGVAVGASASTGAGSCVAIGAAAVATGVAGSTAIGATASATGGIAIGPLSTAIAGEFVAGSTFLGITAVYHGNGKSAALPTAWTAFGTNSSAATVAGGDCTLRGGAGSTTGAGGVAKIQGGTPGTTGVGGEAHVTAGSGGTTSGFGGTVRVSAGSATVGSGGGVLITAGSGLGGLFDGGRVLLTAGAASGGGTPGTIDAESRFRTKKNAVPAASSATMSLGAGGNYFDVSGTTTINGITTLGWRSGSVVTLKFISAITVTHGSGAPGAGAFALSLEGSTNFVATAGSTLTLVFDSDDSRWIEVARMATTASSTGLSTLFSQPSTSRVHGPASPDGGEDTSLVYNGLGQGSMAGFWQSVGPGVIGAVATEVDGALGKNLSYFSAGFFDDSVGANLQTITFYGSVPGGFSTFGGAMSVLTKYVAETGLSPVTTTLTIEVLNPATGAVAASSTRVLSTGGPGPFDANYVSMTIAAATLNAVGFAAGDMFAIRLSCVPSAAGAGEVKTVRFSRIALPWA